MRNKPLMIVSIFVLVMLIAYSGYFFLKTHQYEEVVEYAPFKGEARNNPLYAARLFLKKMGIPTENKDNLQTIDKLFFESQTAQVHKVMIIDADHSTLSLDRAEELLQWMRHGGHIITGVSLDANVLEYFDETSSEDDTDCHEEDPNCSIHIASNDPLQNVLDISAKKSVYIDKQKDNTATSNNDSNGKDKDVNDKYPFEQQYDVFFEDNIKDLRTFPIALSNSSKRLTLAIKPHFYSINSKESNESRVLIKDEIFMLQRKIGKGMITFIADLSIFENQLLRDSDNAEILWYLVHSNHKEPTVWLFHNNEMPNLLSLIWRYGWAVVMSLSMLLLAWTYQSIHRFGPLIPKKTMNRRRLLEHIKASGEYFWKKKNKHILIESTRQALHRRISQVHPAWENSNESDKILHLSEMLDITPSRIQFLLFNNQIHQDDDFTQLINELESIRRQL